ncbi:hypothetical protein EYA42_23735 [Salmonella enterica subsp. enterica serovar Derby]|uniref:Uncharacterized protein n=1 Tax=Salmonella derby TaxID=28144 RepID=A0A610X2K6_SALDE|nr:hypothetical protein [Salmonella enterica]ECG3934503.1 hypothetical protein [Salmonella enterica subsp. enterica serovar Derby]EAX4726644.1 hypothetical protein [Salmonella enterica]EBQ2363803.1 hypothetical protein [Salmonella enterica]ECV7047681.1 hypothetical protein [Salmonella enterica subsp. enterica serovar Derby]
MSVRFCDACQGGEAYGKTPLGAWPYSLCSARLVLLTYAFISCKAPSARRRQVTERSERTVEEAEKNRR